MLLNSATSGGTAGTGDTTIKKTPTTTTPTSPYTSTPGPTLAQPLPLAPTQPPPLTTSDPLAYAPETAAAGNAPYVAPTGQSFVGGTQTTDPATGQVTNSGQLGYGYVPGSSNGLIDLGGGMVAPTTANGTGVNTILDPILTAGYQAPGTVTSQGRVVGSTYDENGNPQPIYDNSVSDPNVAPTQSSPVTTQQQLDAFRNLLTPAGPAAYGTSGASSTPPPGGVLGGVASAVQRLLGPSGSANDAGTPSTPLPGGAGTLPPQTNGGNGTPGTPGGAASGPAGINQSGLGYGLTPTTPQNALTNYTITPDNSIDRFKIAQDQFKNFTDATAPQYEAQLRDAQNRAFGAGRGVSGAMRTSLGDLANQRSLALDTQRNQFLDTALQGKIGDLYKNIGIAQQQQGFQAGQQGTAFNQALQQLLIGSQGDPSQIALILSQIYGSQGGNIGQAAQNYAASQGDNGSQAFNDYLLQLIRSGQVNSGGSGSSAAGPDWYS